MFNLPSITSRLPNDVRCFLDRVREAFAQGGGIVTQNDLVQAGVIRRTKSGGVEPVANRQTIIPPAAMNVTASGSMTSIFVEFDLPAYDGHAYAEIWRAEVDDIGQAQLIGQTPGTFYADAVGAKSTRYYWVRLVSISDDAGAFNGTAGTKGETAANPGYLLEQLTGHLSASHLHSALSSRIDMIDAADTVAGSVNARLKSARDNLQAQINAIANIPDYSGTSVYAEGDMAKYSGGLYRALQATTGNLPTNTTYWTKVGDYTSLGEAVADLSAKIDALNYVNVGSTSASASQLATLKTAVGGSDSGLVKQVGDLETTYGSTASAATSAASAATSAMNAAGSATSAASSLSQVQSIANNYNGAVQTLARTTAGPDGATAQYTVKVQTGAGGEKYVAGFGLSSETNSAGQTTNEFAIVADKFSIAPVATDHAANDGSPFFVLTSPTSINGVTIPAGVYMKATFIHDASITNAKIGNLSAEKITTGDISADRMKANTVSAINLSTQYINAIRIDTRGLSIKDENGNIILAAGTPLNGSTYIASGSIGSAQIATAAITTAKIGDGSITTAKIADVIQSTGYSEGVSGWRISKSGEMEMNSGTFRGTLDVTSAESGARLEIKGDVIKVFDGNGTLRVKIGNLSA